MNELQFPINFFWGAGTSAHQVEGNNTNNDWWDAERKGLVPTQSDQACDHYNRFTQDFDLAKSLGHNAHRFSLEWSRLEPEPGKFNEQATIHYRRVILYLREHGIEPIVTLHHFTNPKWFSDLGGWTNSKAPRYFIRYVNYCLENFGDYVKWWVTINEPTVYAYMGYINRKWPPFRKSLFQAWKVLRYMNRAHKKAYLLIHQFHPDSKVGIAHNISAYEPMHKFNILEKVGTKIFKIINNHYPVFLSRNYCDFIGLNYYFYKRVYWNKLPNIIAPDFVQRSDMGWEINPNGLLQVLRELKKYNKPILVTENGLADKNDDKRWPFILNHLLMIYTALSEGINVKGYLYWSLLDNFEWADGFEPRFGLIGVDYSTQQRIVRPSAWEYANIIKHNAISFDTIAPLVKEKPNNYPLIFQKFFKKINRLNPIRNVE